MNLPFAVLPDTADSRRVRALLFAKVFAKEFPGHSEVVAHPSGQPWLVGRWASDECTVAATPRVKVAVIGLCPVTADRLAELAAPVRAVTDAGGLAALARQLPGSFHLAVSAGGLTRVQGSVGGLRRVFHTTVDGVPVACDRADVLAGLVGGEIDEELLAARVVCGRLPPPLGERSAWRRVTAVPPDHALTLRPDLAVATRWWIPPEPELPLADGAPMLRNALESAIDCRQPDEGRLSADLSGGTGSTSLCFLAARTNPELITVRWSQAGAVNGYVDAGTVKSGTGTGRGDTGKSGTGTVKGDTGTAYGSGTAYGAGYDDAEFATAAATALGMADHFVLSPAELPAEFADLAALADIPALGDSELPYPFARTAARTRHTARMLAERGSRGHLAGHGGDELFGNFPGYLHRLLRSRPLTALHHVQGQRALHRWPLGATVAALARPGDPATWWRAQADGLSLPFHRRVPPLGWGLAPLRAAPWATPEAVRIARRVLRQTAEKIRPFSADPGQHQCLFALRSNATAYGQLARLHSSSGVPLHLPFYDDRVVEAALHVRLHDRATPWRHKPLLAEAVRGVVPGDVLHRVAKGEFSGDVRTGLRHSMPAVLELLAHSKLAERGLIDIGILRSRLLVPRADLTVAHALEDLLGCEAWLRAVTRSTTARRTNAPSSAP